MDVRVDAEQSTATARGVADPADTLEPRNNEGQDQDLRSAPFACNVCKRSYSRVDHLARHHRSRGFSILYRGSRPTIFLEDVARD